MLWCGIAWQKTLKDDTTWAKSPCTARTRGASLTRSRPSDRFIGLHISWTNYARASLSIGNTIFCKYLWNLDIIRTEDKPWVYSVGKVAVLMAATRCSISQLKPQLFWLYRRCGSPSARCMIGAQWRHCPGCHSVRILLMRSYHFICGEIFSELYSDEEAWGF